MEWGDEKNRTMKYFISKSVILLSVFIGFQCSSSSSEDPQPVVSPPPPCQIKSFGSVSMDGSTFFQDTVIYDYTDSRISKAKYGQRLNTTGKYTYQTFTYKYYKDRLPSVIQSDKGTKFEFTYNDSDQVIKRIFTLQGALMFHEDLSYHANGAIKRIVKSDGKGGIWEKLYFTYVDENPSIVTDSITGLETPVIYQFTVGTNLFQPFHLTTMLDPTRFDFVGFKNNVNQITATDARQPLLRFTNNTYNVKGYPVQLRGSKRGGNYTEKYVFDCQ